MVLVSGCTQKPKIEYYPQYIKPKKCAQPFDDPIHLKQWEVGTHMGNPKNVKITMENVDYMLYQIQQRDGTIKCYSDQAE